MDVAEYKLEALFWGGDPPSGASVALAEKYDGVSWTEVGDLNTAREVGGGAGDTSTGLAVGSNAIPTNNATEEWSIPQNVKIITD